MLLSSLHSSDLKWVMSSSRYVKGVKQMLHRILVGWKMVVLVAVQAAGAGRMAALVTGRMVALAAVLVAGLQVQGRIGRPPVHLKS